MKKSEFCRDLEKLLEGLPENDIRRSLDYYGEMIDDRIEEGMDEDAAVAAVGTPEAVAREILGEGSAPCPDGKKKEAPPKTGKRRLSAWEVVIIILGSPLWLSLIVAAVAIIFAVYAVIWSMVAVLWAVMVTLGAVALAAVAYTVVYMASGNIWAGLFVLGSGLLLAGLGIFMFFGCLYATKSLCVFSKRIFLYTLKKTGLRKEAL